MVTFCPHCSEEVSADELVDGDDVWECFSCQHGNANDTDECVCGLSRETSDYMWERDA